MARKWEGPTDIEFYTNQREHPWDSSKNMTSDPHRHSYLFRGIYNTAEEVADFLRNGQKSPYWAFPPIAGIPPTYKPMLLGKDHTGGDTDGSVFLSASSSVQRAMDYAIPMEQGKDGYIMVIRTNRALQTPKHKNQAHARDFEWLIPGQIRDDEIMDIIPMSESATRLRGELKGPLYTVEGKVDPVPPRDGEEDE